MSPQTCRSCGDFGGPWPLVRAVDLVTAPRCWRCLDNNCEPVPAIAWIGRNGWREIEPEERQKITVFASGGYIPGKQGLKIWAEQTAANMALVVQRDAEDEAAMIEEQDAEFERIYCARRFMGGVDPESLPDGYFDWLEASRLKPLLNACVRNKATLGRINPKRANRTFGFFARRARRILLRRNGWILAWRVLTHTSRKAVTKNASRASSWLHEITSPIPHFWTGKENHS